MATTDQIWQGLTAQIETAMAGTNPLLYNSAVSPQPSVVIDWPPVQAIAAVSQATLPTIVSIFDRGAEKNDTHAINLFFALPPTFGTPGSTISLNMAYLPPGETVTLTGSGTPNVNDAFCLTLAVGVGDTMQQFARYTTVSGDTLASALTLFTAQINLLPNISAVLVGPVITVTNNTSAEFNVWSEVVNIGTFSQEGYRWCRDIQVTVWSRTPSDRSKYGNVLEQLFSQMELNFGFQAADQSWCRVLYVDDHVWKDSQLQDIYRRDFMLKCDYALLNVVPGFKIETIPQTFGTPVPD